MSCRRQCEDFESAVKYGQWELTHSKDVSTTKAMIACKVLLCLVRSWSALLYETSPQTSKNQSNNSRPSVWELGDGSDMNQEKECVPTDQSWILPRITHRFCPLEMDHPLMMTKLPLPSDLLSIWTMETGKIQRLWQVSYPILFPLWSSSSFRMTQLLGRLAWSRSSCVLASTR